MGTWRKAYGVLKDSTRVGLAKVNSDFKDLDIAIVKATNHVECPPKERHVRSIFAATAASRPRADVAYCIYALGRRLYKTRNWTVALKTLIVFHRLFREGDPTFKEEMLGYSLRRSVLQISNFKDDSDPLAWDCSGWVRTYALYLEERLECFRILKYDIEAEHVIISGPESIKGHSRTKTLCCSDLLEQLPALQQLLFRLMGCQPERGAYGNLLIQYALVLVLKESFKIYWAINDGIINLVDMFFDMTKLDAVKAFAIYKRAGQQAEALSEFYEFSRHLDFARTFQFPTLRQPPSSFYAAMEEYIREAPGGPSAVSNNLPEPEVKNLLTSKQEEVPPVEEDRPDEQQPPEEEQPPEPEPAVKPEPQPDFTGDLLGLDEVNPAAAEIEQNNASALAIASPGDAPNPSTSLDLLAPGSSGWELALVTTTSSSTSHVDESKLAGGFDKLLLDSLYEDSSRRQQIAAGYGGGSYLDSSPFDQRDPFVMSNSFAPPTGVQMSLMSQQLQQQSYYYHLQEYCYNPQQQQQFLQNQQMMAALYQPQHPQQHTAADACNPFGDPFAPQPRKGNLI